MDEKVAEYRKMIKEKGLKDAIENMKSTGGLYEGDFVEDKKNNPIFKEEEIEDFAKHLREPEKVEVTIANQEPSVTPFVSLDYEIDGQRKRVDQKVSPDTELFVYYNR